MSGNSPYNRRNMAPREAPEKSPSDEVARLGQELEQARVALEDAHNEIAVLTEEHARLERRVKAHNAARMLAQAGEKQARQQAAALVAAATAEDADLNLRQMLEETSLLGEERG